MLRAEVKPLMANQGKSVLKVSWLKPLHKCQIKERISPHLKAVRGHPAAQLPAGLAWLSLRAWPWLGCMQRAAPALMRLHPSPSWACSLVSLSTSRSQTRTWPREHPKSPTCSQRQGFPWDLGLILVPVNMHIVLYWALLLMCKAEMMAFYCLRRAGTHNGNIPPFLISFHPQMHYSVCVLCPESFTIHR